MERLMIPGPGEVPASGLAEMAKQVLPHYGDDFLKLYDQVRTDLKHIFGTQAEMLILTDPGSAAMELSVSALADRKIVLVNSGFFAGRWREIIHSYGGETVDVAVGERQALNPDDVAAAVKKNRDVAAIAVVHNETSTGIINPVKELGKIAREHDLLLVVDVVSSLGGAEFRMDEWNVDMAFTGMQKALGCPPGVSPLAVNERVWKAIGSGKRGKGWYLNLATWKYYVDEWAWHPYPTSLATPLIASCGVILKEVLKEGMGKRIARHNVAGKAFRSGVKKLGLMLYPEDEKFASPTITAFYSPEGIPEEKIREIMLKEHNIRIAGGIGSLKGRILRVGHMAATADVGAILSTLAALEVTLKQLGHDVTIGSAVKTACEEFYRGTAV